MTNPTFGMELTLVNNQPKPAIWADMSVVGIIGTAPNADTAVFPLDTPVAIYSDDTASLTSLGVGGTLVDAINLLNDQLVGFQAAARVVVVRVDAGADAAATITNMVGDGISTGVSAFLSAGAQLGVTPRLICAPGFTGTLATDGTANPVTVALVPILERLVAHAVVDGPGTTEAAAATWRAAMSSQRLIPVEPAALVYSGGVNVTVPLSPAVIGIAVARDYQFGGRPFHSWANQAVQGIVGPSRPIAFSLTDGATEGQTLLAANIGILIRGEMGVANAINSGGYVFIGTDNAGSDPNWQFYNVTRGRDYIHLMLLQSLQQYLGKYNLTGQTVQSVVNTMTKALTTLKSQGDILGYKISFTRNSNNTTDLQAGKFTIDFQAQEAPVLRNIAINSGQYLPAVNALLSDLIAQLGNVSG